MSDMLEVAIERPVAGGRMLARHDGRIVFVSGAIPGERVRARVERATKQSLWATVIEILEASPDRREVAYDPACGGSTFAHIQYERQRELKQQILIDAFRRIAHVSLNVPPVVAASPEHGYRLRARLHAGHDRLGFFLEGSHTVCDAAATSQLLPESTQAAVTLFGSLGPRAVDCVAIVVAENVSATERVLHLELREGRKVDDAAAEIARIPGDQLPGVTGVTTLVRGKVRAIRGRESVTDSSDALFGGASPIDSAVSWTRRAPAFFQGNRYLAGTLVRRVLDLAEGDRIVDLYAGVGLFSVALAASGAHVVAVEAEPVAAEDLLKNAEPWGARLEVMAATVEDVVARGPGAPPATVVLDPPRTGISPQALAGLVAWRVPRLVYVSCDPPTLARDAAKLIVGGYALASVDAFDMFPNTPHVEAIAVFALADRPRV